MAFNYKKFWKLLINKDMKKTSIRLPESARLQLPSMPKMKMSQLLSIVKVCKSLGYNIGDDMEIIGEK